MGGREVHCDLRDRLVLESCSSWVIIGGGAAGVGSAGEIEKHDSDSPGKYNSSKQ